MRGCFIVKNLRFSKQKEEVEFLSSILFHTYFIIFLNIFFLIENNNSFSLIENSSSVIILSFNNSLYPLISFVLFVVSSLIPITSPQLHCTMSLPVLQTYVHICTYGLLCTTSLRYHTFTFLNICYKPMLRVEFYKL